MAGTPQADAENEYWGDVEGDARAGAETGAKLINTGQGYVSRYMFGSRAVRSEMTGAMSRTAGPNAPFQSSEASSNVARRGMPARVYLTVLKRAECLADS